MHNICPANCRVSTNAHSELIELLAWDVFTFQNCIYLKATFKKKENELKYANMP